MTRSILSLILLAAMGCGAGSAPIALVSGRVTLDGQPLAKASVQFMPIAPEGSMNAPGPGSTGVTDQNGEFTLMIVGSTTPGAVVGEHRVIIQTAFSPGRGDGPGSKEKLPARYHANTELRFLVKLGGSTDAKFELLSR